MRTTVTAAALPLGTGSLIYGPQIMNVIARLRARMTRPQQPGVPV